MFNQKNLINYGAPVLVILLAALLYCFPVLQGKTLKQDDIVNHKGMSTETEAFRAEHGEEPLWMGNAFSGMTTYFVGTKFKTNVFGYIQKTIGLIPHPAHMMFLLGLGVYLLLLSLKANPWAALGAGLVFMFSTNFLIPLVAGHNSKIMTICWFLFVLAGNLFVVNRKNIISGGLLSAFGVGMMLVSGHYQIMYYGGIAMIIFHVCWLLYAGLNKNIPEHAKGIGILLIGAALALIPNYSRISNIQAHTSETMRGTPSHLTDPNANQKAEGLDFAYAMNWSYGVGETGTLMFQGFKGGASADAGKAGSAVHDLFKEKFRIKDSQQLGPVPIYHGPQQFTSPVYIGAVAFYLFFIGLFMVKRKHVAWMLAVGIFGLLIAFGKHFGLLNETLFYNLPMFDKFRNPSMNLFLVSAVVVSLGFLVLSRLKDISKDDAKKGFLRGSIATGTLLLLVALGGAMSNFDGGKRENGGDGYLTMEEADEASIMNPRYGLVTQVYGEKVNDPKFAAQILDFKSELLDAIRADRKSVYLKSVFRSTLLIALVAGLLWLFIRGKVKYELLLVAIIALGVYDVVKISLKHFNEDNFSTERKIESTFKPDAADRRIKSDPDPHYRVLSYTDGLFSDAKTPANHKSILGYSPAKIRVYQDLVEGEKGGQLAMQIGALRNAAASGRMSPQVFEQLPVINMLNTKYIKFGKAAEQVIMNPYAFGPAWYVTSIKTVSNADAEMAALNNPNLRNEAIAQDAAVTGLGAMQFDKDSLATVRVTNYNPNHITYEAENSGNGFIVFSEVYYENGWEAMVDGVETPIYKVNYVLRGIEIPAGKHKVEMVFAPSSYPSGERISMIGSIIMIIAFAVGGFLMFRRRRERNESLDTTA